MEVEVANEEIVIRLPKKDHKQLFERIPVMRNVKAYFEYLLDLDYQLNGTDSQLNGYQIAESFAQTLEKMSDEDLEKTKEEILQDIYNHVNYIYDAVPEEYTFTTYDYDLAFIAEDDSVAYLKLATDKLKALMNFLKSKNGK